MSGVSHWQWEPARHTSNIVPGNRSFKGEVSSEPSSIQGQAYQIPKMGTPRSKTAGSTSLGNQHGSLAWKLGQDIYVAQFHRRQMMALHNVSDWDTIRRTGLKFRSPDSRIYRVAYLQTEQCPLA